MPNDFQQLFNHLQAPEPHPGLLGAIIKRIDAERMFAVKRRFAIFSAGFFVSFFALLPVFNMMRADMVQSGFAEFFSLLFSDIGMVAVYWQNFSITLLESLPAASIAAFLATVFVFLGSLRFITRDMK
ncbi:MAG: hypothetical protein Q7S16_02940, partial [bacterium]|nr:hypothetical protein [bacterium]